MNYKREHQYKLRMHEEKLYKEVSYDPRPKFDHQEEFRTRNLLRKVKGPRVATNLTETIKKAQEILP
jgi:hypothetical protein